MQTVSAGYTEGVMQSQQRMSAYSEAVHNQQVKDLVIVPSSSEEVMSQILSTSAALRGAQPPIAPAVG
jgi:hypothetical protein